MQIFSSNTFSIEQAGILNRLCSDYLFNPTKLRSFYIDVPAIESFVTQIEKRKSSQINRSLLLEVLTSQYKQSNLLSETISKQINTLASANTFTITTGHQLCLFGGPMYFIYKIVSVINLSKQLKKAYPAYHFVPVFWMATEDHDFAEINHFNLFGKRINWEQKSGGAVGEISTEGLSDIYTELSSVLGNHPNAAWFLSLFDKAYLKQDTLANATRVFVNELFGNEGLVCIDANDAQLKQQFASVVQKDMFEQIAFNKINETDARLSKDYKLQISAREINFFYMDKALRERILFEDGMYKVLNTSLQFSKSEMENLIENNPEKLSPNVALRPLYQESILPNLAYIGGGAEVAYWLQLKSTFDACNVHYPIVMLRNSALVLNASTLKKMNKLDFLVDDFFKDIDLLIKEKLDANTAFDLQLSDEKKSINQIFTALKKQVEAIDTTLLSSVEAENQKTLNALDNLSSKLLRAEKRKNEVMLSQIESLYDKAFPNGTFQERSENFSSISLNYGSSFIDYLLHTFNPFEKDLYVIEEKNPTNNL